MIIACSTGAANQQSLEKALALVNRLGFKFVDVLAIEGWVHISPSKLVLDFDSEVGKLAALLDKYQLKISAFNSGTGQALHDRSPEAIIHRKKELEAILRMMNYFKIDVSALQPRNNDQTRSYDSVFSDCVNTLWEILELASTYGKTLALELHINSPFETMGQIQRLLKEMPALPIAYDPSHFVMQDIPLDKTFWLLPNSKIVHLRDASQGNMQMLYGKGTMDFDLLLKEMIKTGYDGSISIEFLEREESVDLSYSILGLREKILEYFPVS